MDYCSDKIINREYAKLFWKINKMINIYNTFTDKGVKNGYKELEDRFSSLGLKINKKDYLYILDSVAYLFDNNKTEENITNVLTNVKNFIPRNIQDERCKVNKLDIKLTTNDIHLSDDSFLPIYPVNESFNLIKGILFGDPENDVVLNLTNENLKEAYIDSSVGTVTIDYIKVKRLEITTSTGDVYINLQSIIDELIINTSAGDINIANAKIRKINVSSDTSDIVIDNQYADDIVAKSEIGDIKINSNTNNIIIKSDLGDVDIITDAQNVLNSNYKNQNYSN